MIKYVNTDIVFQEYPNETALCINLSLCPNHCPGCHSAYLAEDIGEELTPQRLLALIDDYRHEITCVGLQGGDNDTAALNRLAAAVRKHCGDALKIGWYSGRDTLPDDIDLAHFDYIKLGPWRQECGPLNKPTTNQRLFRVIQPEGTLQDITSSFWKVKS